MTSSRITTAATGDRFLTNLQGTYRTLSSLQEQISSGQRVNRPSDDPLAAAQARLRQVDLDQIAASKKSAESATTWLSTTETALGNLSDILQRARELTVQGANSTYNQNQRDAIASELDQLAAQAKQLMAAKAGDAYVFCGTKTTTAPYNAGSDAYQGDTNTVSRDVGNATTIAVTVTFGAIGGAATLNARSLIGEGATANDDRVLDTLETIAANMRTSNVGALGTTDLRSLQANLDAVASARAAVGATQNRVDNSISRMDQVAQLANEVLGDLTGTDYTKAITEFNAQQNAYLAALKSGATLVQTSLLDFI